MRKTLFLLLCMLVSFSIFSKTTDSRDIELRARQSGQEALRSILPVRAWLEGNSIWVEFLSLPGCAVVTIKGKDGSDVITKIYESPKLIQLPSIQQYGEYILEITYGDTILSGYFIIE